MKTRSIVSILFVIFYINTFAENNKTTLASKLEEAKVFYNGAELTHSANTNLLKGENEVYIEGLSPNIDKNSIKIKTTNGVIVSSFEFSIDYLSQKSLNPQIQKIKDDIEAQEKLLAQTETDIKTTSNLLSILQKGVDKSIAGTDKALSIDELLKTMEQYKTKSLELEKSQKDNTQKKNQIIKSIGDLKAQFDQESLKNNKIAGLLKVNLSAPANTSCNFLITYYTTSAGWYPYYDINVQSTDNPVKITTKAKVSQVTGIDWDKVKISLSTASPSSGKVAPLFNTWFLEYMYEYAFTEVYDEVMVQNYYSYNKVEESKEIYYDADYDDGYNQASSTEKLYIIDGIISSSDYYYSIDPDKIKNVEHLDASNAVKLYGSSGANGAVIIQLKNNMNDFVHQSENQLNIVFNIDMSYSIPGNGKEQSIELKTQEVNAIFKYYSAPKLDTETFLLAEITEWQKLNLLSAYANITYDGTYIGETYINAESTHENLNLTLGTDKRVVVKREKQKDFSSTKTFGSDTKQEFSYLLTVRNNQNKPIKMVLKDQYPISTTKEINVELSKNTTTPSFNKEDIGVISWEFELQPGETKTFNMAYTVKYPKNKQLNF